MLVLLINDKAHDLNGARDDDDGYVLEVVGTKIFFILPQKRGFRNPGFDQPQGYDRCDHEHDENEAAKVREGVLLADGADELQIYTGLPKEIVEQGK